MREERAVTEICNMTRSDEVTTKAHIFVSIQLALISVAHHPTFRRFTGKSLCMPGCSYSTYRQYFNVTIAVANRSRLSVILL